AGVFTYNNDIDRDESYRGELTVGGGPPSAFAWIFDPDFATTSKRSQRSIYLGATQSLTQRLSLDGALYWDRYTNTDTISGEQWLSSKLNPRLGLVYRPYARHTFRLASYRYLFSLVPGRIDAVDIAGLDIYRGSSPGSLTTDHRLAYEYDWPTGFLQVEGFVSDVRDEQRSRDSSNLLLRNIINTERDGVGITLNQLAAKSMGLVAEYEYLDIADNQQNINNRREEQARAALTWINGFGITLGAEALYRHLRFANRPADQDYFLFNAFMEFEFPRNLGKLSLQGNNLGDENINWVTDAFVIDGRIPERNWIATLELYF
ncbi:MAG: TonB-dependent receptor, partial [Pseudomonadales bacterium]